MNKLPSSILLLIVFVTLLSCSGERELSEEEVLLSQKISEKLENKTHIQINEDTLTCSSDLLSFYSQHEYAPVWANNSGLNAKGKEFFSIVENSREWGLHPEFYHYSRLKAAVDSNIVDAELYLSNAFLLMATHVSVGFMDSTSKELVWKKDSLKFDVLSLLDEVNTADSIASLLSRNEPKYWEYQQLKKGIKTFINTYPLDTNHFDIPAFKEDSVVCYAVAKKALLAHEYLDSSEAENDSIFIERLKSFQKANGLKDDAIVGKWTGRKLSQSNQERWYQAALAMEKWRWKTTPYPDRYIRVNIPEYTLYFVDSSEIKRKHRVIVGAYATPTPEFNAQMKTIVTYPFWHVPYSISSTEILWAVKKDSSYLRKKGYKIFQGGNEIDPTSVDWSSISQFKFPYKVRQEGGGGNSLGNIKFLFPNEHFVFIHDTPARGLFKNDVRAYSHGCIRLHNPLDLAKAIITSEENRIISDTLDNIMMRKEQRVIEVRKKFQVYIEYISAVGDSSGAVIFYPDIYNRDEKYLKNTLKKFD